MPDLEVVEADVVVYEAEQQTKLLNDSELGHRLLGLGEQLLRVLQVNLEREERKTEKRGRDRQTDRQT